MQSLKLTEWNTFIRWEELPGDGPPIVCLPGISTATVPTFLPLATRPELRGRRIIMIDYLGSGTSGTSPDFPFSLDAHAASIAAVMEAAGCGAATILGHSMGGSVGIALALARPDLVGSLFVCEGNVTRGGGAASTAIAAYSLEDWLASGFEARKAGLEQAALDGAWFAQFLSGARAGIDPRGLHANARALVEVPEDFLDCFLALPMPCHFVYGAETYPPRPEDATPDTPDPERLREAGVATHVVPGVGHFLMAEDPTAFAKVVGPHL